MIVVVGGSSRKSGKTAAVCSIIEATRSAKWTALKITAHAHGADLTQPVIHEEHEPGEHNDTARFVKAGARWAFWIRCQPEHLLKAIEPYLNENVIVESNTAAQLLPDATVVFIEGPEEKEFAAATRARADYTDVILAIRAISEQIASRHRG